MSSVVISGDTSGAVTISAPAVAGTTTLTLPATSGTILQSGTTVTEAQGGTGTSTGYYGFKNRIINSAMVIDQRNAGASVTPTDAQYCVDRWRAVASAASKFTVQQSTTAPDGFTNSLLLTSSSAYTPLTSEAFGILQLIEGFNCADLMFGTATAKTITVSFWVRSSLTGTFGGFLTNASFNRAYPFTYTINSANTFEQKTVTIAGDTTGTWATNSSGCIGVGFSIGAGATLSATAGAWGAGTKLGATGQTQLISTNGATFYITGVQLEKGSTATSFDYRPIGTELALCQRYFQLSRSAFGGGNTSVQALVNIAYRVTMRSTPDLGVQGAISITDGTNDSVQSSGGITNINSDSNAGMALLTNFTGLTVSRVYTMRLANSNAITLSAEL